MRPTVFIVDDHAIFRRGVRAELEGRVEIVGEAGSVEEGSRGVLERSRTSSCSTSTCRAEAGSR